MSTYSEFAEAFTLFAKYGDENYSVVAEHDEIFAGHNIGEAGVGVMSQTDIDRLEELGWTYDDDLECFHHFT